MHNYKLKNAPQNRHASPIFCYFCNTYDHTLNIVGYAL